ncbi:MAG TPA: hypothetical protein VJ183_09305 [Chloroflexia bacterium]|nr:hypothetical protein [Chloroflexia bacterium]
MDNTTDNPGAQSGQSADPNQTRYIPPQGSNGQQGYARPGHGPVAHHGQHHDHTFFALLLIGAGVLFLLQQFSIFRDFGDYLLLIIGGVFMYAYFSTKAGYRAGFLIPGAILLGIGTGEVLQKYNVLGLWQGANVSGLALGLGFCLIWALERRHWWALIPGSILVVSSISGALAIGKLWPVGLILIGVYLLYEQTRRRPR